MIKIEFIKNFAGRKKGDLWECDSMLAGTLIAKKVAKKRKRVTKKNGADN